LLFELLLLDGDGLTFHGDLGFGLGKRAIRGEGRLKLVVVGRDEAVI